MHYLMKASYQGFCLVSGQRVVLLPVPLPTCTSGWSISSELTAHFLTLGHSCLLLQIKIYQA